MSWLNGILGLGNGQSKSLYGQAQGQYGQVRDTGTAYRNMANQQQGRYNTYRPQADAALTGYGNLLTRRMTGEDTAAARAQAMQGVADNYQAGQAGLTANLQQRGISPDSASGIGGQASLANYAAGARANAAQGVYQMGQERQLQGANALYQLLFGEANGAQGNAANYLGQAGNFAGQAAQGYNQLGQQAQQQEQARQQQIMGLIGGAAGAFGLGGGMNRPSGNTYSGSGEASFPGDTRMAYTPGGLPGIDPDYGLDGFIQTQGVPLPTNQAPAPSYRVPMNPYISQWRG